jgi:hypothetical protein
MTVSLTTVVAVTAAAVAVVAAIVAVEDNYWQKRPATRALTVA